MQNPVALFIFSFTKVSSMKTLTIHFEYRPERLSKDGTAPIYLRATYNRKMRRTSTGRKIEPKHWSKERQRVKRTHNNSVQINAILDELRSRANTYYNTVDNFTLDGLMSHLNGEKDRANMVLTFLEEVYNSECKRLSSNTTKQHKVMIDYVTMFNEDLIFADLTYRFKQEFESWLRSQKNDRTGADLHPNYIASICKTLKRYLTKAVRAGKIPANPFEGETIETIATEKTYLTTDELERFELLDVSDRRGYMPETLQMFLFCCYTGLAFIDAITLSREHIKYDGEGFRLKKMRHKTRKKRITVDIPLYMLFEGRPERLIARRMDMNRAYDELFGPFELHFTKTYNDHLKEFARLAGVDKNMSSHVARHTCAMILLNDYGFTFEMVAGILGHKSVSTTQKHYAHLTTTGLDDRIKRVLRGRVD